MFHKELYKTIWVFALKRYYLYKNIDKMVIATEVPKNF